MDEYNRLSSEEEKRLFCVMNWLATIASWLMLRGMQVLLNLVIMPSFRIMATKVFTVDWMQKRFMPE